MENFKEDNTGYSSIDFFLKRLMTGLWGLSVTEWVVTSLGSGRDNDDKYLWIIHLKNIRTKEEKRIEIPCYKD